MEQSRQGKEALFKKLEEKRRERVGRCVTAVDARSSAVVIQGDRRGARRLMNLSFTATDLLKLAAATQAGVRASAALKCGGGRREGAKTGVARPCRDAPRFLLLRYPPHVERAGTPAAACGV